MLVNLLDKVLKYIWVFIVSGAICSVISLCGFFYRKSFLSHAQSTTGMVVEMVKNEEHGTFAPVYTFSDASGTSHKIYSSTGSYPPAYSVGQSIKIFYRQENPEDSVTDRFFDLWGLSLVFGIIGGTHLILGITGSLVQKRRQNRKSINAPTDI